MASAYVPGERLEDPLSTDSSGSGAMFMAEKTGIV